MDKIAQERGIFNKLRENLNIGGMWLERSPEFKN